MTNYYLVIFIYLFYTQHYHQSSAEKTDEQEDEIFSFQTVNKNPIPLRSPSSSSSAGKSSGGQQTSSNPFNGIQELSNQLKDNNFNNIKKLSDNNANSMMNLMSLGSNWMSTNLRLIKQWNDLNQNIGNKVIDSVYNMHENNLKFIKKQIETNNENFKTKTADPLYEKIANIRNTFNANSDGNENQNSLSLVSKSGRPLETLAEIKNELPDGLVEKASGWFGK